MKLAGHSQPGLPQTSAILGRTVQGLRSWTQAVFGGLHKRSGPARFNPFKDTSRLKEMAHAEAILLIPEGVSQLQAGEIVNVHLLS